MNNKLRHYSALISVLVLGACSQTETALTDEPDQSMATENTEVIEPSIPLTDARSTSTEKPEPQEETPPQSQTAQYNPLPAPVKKSESNPATPARTPFRVKRCMNMGNALEAPNEGDWGYRIRQQDLQKIARAGFDTIRLPVRWDTHTANRAPYAIDTSFMTRVQTVVAQAQTAGLGVIIDVHHFEKLMSQPRRQEARFLAMWTQISETFKDAPANIYFEVLNEPTLEISMAEVNALYAKVIPVIRSTNPTRKIIIGGNSWNSVESLSEVRWPDDPNIVATFHDYQPHAFTHQGAEWSEPVMPMGRIWGGQEDAKELKLTYDIAKAFRAKTGLPLLVGEFGVIDKVSQPERMQWTKVRRQTMEANNMAWCVWDFSGAFKTYDLGSGQWLPGVQEALFGR